MNPQYAVNNLVRKFSFFLITIAICFIGCDYNRVYEKNITINKSIWSSTEKVKFDVTVKDTTATYNVYINVRHASIYPYSNLWIMATTVLPDKTIKRQRVEIRLADDEGGWHGEGMGDIWDLKFLAQQNALFNQEGTYSFEFEQIMRQDPLPGIMAMGLRIEKTTPVE